MKKYFFILFILFAFSCKKNEPEKNEIDLTGNYEFTLNTPKNMVANKNTPILTLTEITDSRCPINAICAVAAASTAKLKVQDELGERTIELCLDGCQIFGKHTTSYVGINGSLYMIRMLTLVPSPGEPNYALPNLKATLNITKSVVNGLNKD